MKTFVDKINSRNVDLKLGLINVEIPYNKELIDEIVNEIIKKETDKKLNNYTGSYLDKVKNYQENNRDFKNKAETLVEEMPISITGSRKGDLLLGIKKRTKDGKMRFLSDDKDNQIYPEIKDVQHLIVYRDYGGEEGIELWNEYIVKLLSIDYFDNYWREKNANADIQDKMEIIEKWLYDNAIPYELFGSKNGEKDKTYKDYKDFKVEIIDFSYDLNENKDSLSEQIKNSNIFDCDSDVNSLIDEHGIEPWKIEYVLMKAMKKEKGVLQFSKEAWQIIKDIEKTDKFTGGLLINLSYDIDDKGLNQFYGKVIPEDIKNNGEYTCSADKEINILYPYKESRDIKIGLIVDKENEFERPRTKTELKIDGNNEKTDQRVENEKKKKNEYKKNIYTRLAKNLNIPDITLLELEKVKEELFNNLNTTTINKKEDGRIGIYKSFLQKLIRFRPENIKYKTKVFNAKNVLVVLIIEIIFNIGGYNSTLKYTESGLSALTKRLGVICLEDSYTENYEEIVALFYSAYLKKFNKNWMPSNGQIYKWVKFGLDIYNSDKVFVPEKATNYSWSEWLGPNTEALSTEQSTAKKKEIPDWIKSDIDRYQEPYRYFTFKDLYNDTQLLKEDSICNILMTCILQPGILQSLSGDMRLTNYIANVEYFKNKKNQFSPDEIKKYQILTNENLNKPEFMDFTHCLDHHCVAHIAYFFNIKTIPEPIIKSKPFSELFNKIFKNVSGVNSRRKFEYEDGWNNFDFSRWMNLEFIKETQLAQSYLFNSMLMLKQEKFKNNGSDYEFNYILEPGWISSLIGDMKTKTGEIIKGKKIIGVLDAFNPAILRAITVPKSGKDDLKPEDLLNTEEEEKAINHFKSILKKGISLGNNENIPDKNLIDKTIILKDDNKFYIKETDQPWGTNDKNERILDIKINSIKNINLDSKKTDWRNEETEQNKFYSYYFRIKSDQDTLGINYDLLIKLIKSKDNKLLRNSLRFLDTFNKNIKMNTITRDGGSETEIVLFNDIETFQFLHELCLCAPSAIIPSNDNVMKFKSNSVLLLQHINEIIKNQLNESTDNDVFNWQKQGQKIPQDNIDNAYSDNEEKRKLYEGKNIFDMIEPLDYRTYKIIDFESEKLDKEIHYQEDTIKEMKPNIDKKGNILWITPGLGKTNITLWYLKQLFDLNRLPKYIVYTLPEGAIDTVITQLLNFNIKVKRLSPLIGSINKSYTKIDSMSDIPKHLIGEKGYSVSSSKDANDVCVPNEVDGGGIEPGCFNVIEHDHLIKMSCDSEIMNLGNDLLFIVDELHKALNNSGRTGAIYSIAKVCKEFIGLTGTLIKDVQTDKLLKWYRLLLNYPINENNIYVAQTAVITKLFRTDVNVIYSEPEKIEYKNWNKYITQEKIDKYKKITLHKYDGDNKEKNINLEESHNISYEIAFGRMVEKTKELLNFCNCPICKKGQKDQTPITGTNHVMIITANKEQQIMVADLLYDEGRGIDKKYILLINKYNNKKGYPYIASPNITDKIKDEGININGQKYQDFKVVITILTKCEGYNLTRFGNVITTYYTGNIGDKIQMNLRVNRLGQNRSLRNTPDGHPIKEIGFYRFYAGTLEIKKKKEEADFDAQNTHKQVK